MKYTKEMKLLSDLILEEDMTFMKTAGSNLLVVDKPSAGFETVDIEAFFDADYAVTKTPSGKFYRWGWSHRGELFLDKKARLELVKVFKHTEVTIEETWHTSKQDIES